MKEPAILHVATQNDNLWPLIDAAFCRQLLALCFQHALDFANDAERTLQLRSR